MDIFTRIEREQRLRALMPPKPRKVTRYQIVRGDGYKAYSKLYTKDRATKLIARAARFGLDVYLSSPLKVWE